MQTRMKPSIFTILKHQSSLTILLGLGGNFLLHFVVALVNVAIFAFGINTVGFWYSVAILGLLRIIFSMLREYRLFQIEEDIMKGGK